jgi:hypothetical protein
MKVDSYETKKFTVLQGCCCMNGKNIRSQDAYKNRNIVANDG